MGTFDRRQDEVEDGDKTYIQVRLKRTTTQRLKKFGTMGDSYDYVINKLIDNFEKD